MHPYYEDFSSPCFAGLHNMVSQYLCRWLTVMRALIRAAGLLVENWHMVWIGVLQAECMHSRSLHGCVF